MDHSSPSELCCFLVDLVEMNNTAIRPSAMPLTIVADNAKMHYNKKSVRFCTELLKRSQQQQRMGSEPSIEEVDEDALSDTSSVHESVVAADVNDERWESSSPTEHSPTPPNRFYPRKKRNDSAITIPNRLPSPSPLNRDNSRGLKNHLTTSKRLSRFESFARFETTVTTTTTIARATPRIDYPPYLTRSSSSVTTTASRSNTACRVGGGRGTRNSTGNMEDYVARVIKVVTR